VRPHAALLVVLACVAAAACGARTPDAKVAPESAAVLTAAAPLADDAQRATAEGRWDDAIGAYERFLAKIGDDAALAGWRDFALYNVACAHARAGRTTRAAQSFAESVVHGLRPRIERVGSGWTEVSGLTIEHVLADADLDPIRREPAYLRALESLVAAGEPLLQAVGPGASRVPGVVALAAEDEEAANALAVWRAAAKGRALVLAVVEGPVRPHPNARRWQVGDFDERWAVAKVRAAAERLLGDARVDPSRVYVAGIGPRPGDAAWGAALSLGPQIAGFAAPEGRFDPYWRADAVAAAPASWRVALAPADTPASSMLREHGIDVLRAPRFTDPAATAAAILDALLR
jgi:hypothetical protein